MVSKRTGLPGIFIILLFCTGAMAQQKSAQKTSSAEFTDVKESLKRHYAPATVAAPQADLIIARTDELSYRKLSNAVSDAESLNNSCGDAIKLPANGTVTRGTTRGSNTQQGETPAGFPQSVWYYFVATSSEMYVDVEPAKGSDYCHPFTAIYAGNCLPTSATLLTGSTSGKKNYHHLKKLTEGNTYLVQVAFKPTGTCTAADFMISIGKKTNCTTGCTTIRTFPSSPSTSDVLSQTSPYPLIPVLRANESRKECFSFMAGGITLQLQMVIGSRELVEGNVSDLKWSLYKSNSTTAFQSGTLQNMTLNSMNIGDEYTLCIEWIARNTQDVIYPYLAATSPLPVNVTQFTSDQSGKSVLLNWITNGEFNNAYFSINRSSNGNDFSEIAKVHGKGTTTETTRYKYVDRNPVDGYNWYRLKRCDFDGTCTPSQITKVKFVKSFSIKQLTNPVDNVVEINIHSDHEQELGFVMLADGGKVVKEVTQSIPAGGGPVMIPVGNLDPGQYTLRISDAENHSSTQTVTISR